jgi:hypothetical protein
LLASLAAVPSLGLAANWVDGVAVLRLHMFFDMSVVLCFWVPHFYSISSVLL